MDSISILAAGIFCVGYILITLEHTFNTHKSAVALTMSGILWLLAAIKLHDHPHELEAALHTTGSDVFGIVAFLLAAMALIEILVHYRFFDFIRSQLIRLRVGDKEQFLVIMAMTFCLSAVLDNIAVTIAMLQIARRFFTGKNLLVAIAGVVVLANAGGAWSPIGDTTTLLLWLADKYTATEVMRYAILPSLTLAIIVVAMLYRQLDNDNFLSREKGDVMKLSSGEKAVIVTALGSFTLPLVISSVGLPPYMGLLFGLGVTWTIIELAKGRGKKAKQTHLTANLEKLIQTVDIATVKYLIGILLSVMALVSLGVLAWVSDSVIGAQASDARIIGSNFGLGILSGVVDNTSLVALAINSLPTNNSELWTLTAIAAGNGGSLLLIGSAAGVIASGTFKQMSFGTYLRIATVPVLLGLLGAYGVWLIQWTYF
jgi:Na+/H+ antiporter NhaD/arsenite permease-like protein